MSAMAEFFKWCKDEIVQKHKDWDINELPQDVVSWLLKAYVEKDISAAPTAIALHDDSRAVLVAGSETTATTLASTLYYLCKSPNILHKRQRLLDEAIPGGSCEWSYVFVPTQLLQTNERYYVHAKRFIPERWSESKDMVREPDAPYFPFLYGPYVCPGKNLALVSLRISVSKLAQLYDIRFAPGETGEIFEAKTLDTFTTTLPPLHVQFVRR
ncbi:cytochrome P450 [Aspergillus oleicola]